MTTGSESAELQRVLDFWFEPDHRPAWFSATPVMDALIRENFEAMWREVQADESLYATDSSAALALIILLDQMPLNMFRGQGIRYSTAGRAADIARDAIEKGWDQSLTDEQKAFLYMPLMHSENLGDQDLSVACYEKAGLADNLRFARHHRDIVRRFGRFPHRNEELARASTADELAWLASDDAFKA